MGFQTVITQFQTSGFPGELYSDYPVGSDAFTVNSSLATPNTIGFATSFTGVQGEVQTGNPGGTSVFAGYMVNSKAQASFGTAGNPLAPTIDLPDNTIVDVLNMGTIWVMLTTTASVGDWVTYDQTTGELSAIAPNATPGVGTSFGYAKVVIYPVTTPGLAVIQVNYVITPGL